MGSEMCIRDSPRPPHRFSSLSRSSASSSSMSLPRTRTLPPPIFVQSPSLIRRWLNLPARRKCPNLSSRCRSFYSYHSYHQNRRCLSPTFSVSAGNTVAPLRRLRTQNHHLFVLVGVLLCLCLSRTRPRLFSLLRRRRRRCFCRCCSSRRRRSNTPPNFF